MIAGSLVLQPSLLLIQIFSGKKEVLPMLPLMEDFLEVLTSPLNIIRIRQKTLS
jgi:hypothetical protein